MQKKIVIVQIFVLNLVFKRLSSLPRTNLVVYQSSLLNDGSVVQCYGTCAKKPASQITFKVSECYGKRLQIDCNHGTRIHIQSAIIGKMALDHDLCVEQESLKCKRNISSNLTNHCGGKQKCTINLTKFGAAGGKKCSKMAHVAMDVQYSCKKKKKVMKVKKRLMLKVTTTAIPPKPCTENDVTLINGDVEPFWLMTTFELLKTINKLKIRSRHITLIVLFSVFLGMILYLCYFLQFCKKEKRRREAIAKRKKDAIQLIKEPIKNDRDENREREFLPPPDGFSNNGANILLTLSKIVTPPLAGLPYEDKDETDFIQTIPQKYSPKLSPSFSTDTSNFFNSQNVIPPPVCLSPLSLAIREQEEKYFIAQSNTPIRECSPFLSPQNDDYVGVTFPEISILNKGLCNSVLDYDASASGNDGNDSSLPTTPSIIADGPSRAKFEICQRNPILDRLLYKLHSSHPKCKRKLEKHQKAKSEKDKLDTEKQKADIDLRDNSILGKHVSHSITKCRPYSQPNCIERESGLKEELDLSAILDMYQSKSNRESRHIEGETVKMPLNSFATIDKNYFLKKSMGVPQGSKSCGCNIDIHYDDEKEFLTRAKKTAPKSNCGYRGQIASIRDLYCPNGFLYPRFKNPCLRYPEEDSSSSERSGDEQAAHFIESGYQSNGTDSGL